MRPRYLGPLVVVSRNKGGAYIVCELDGTLYHNPVVAYRVIPYFARDYIELPNFEKYSDVSVRRLREMERSTAADPNDPTALRDSSADEEVNTEPWQAPGDDDELDNDDNEAEDEFDTLDID